MNKIIIILAGGAIFATAPVAAQTDTQTTTEAASQKDAAALARGAQAWANNCSRCHNLRSPSELNAELWGVSVQHMRVRANLPGKVAEDIKAFLISSVEPSAPSTAPVNTGATAGAYEYLRPGDPARGEVVFSQTCIACHGADGKGTIPGVPDFTASNGRLTKSDDMLLTNMINGYQSEGSLMAMPALGGNPDLTEQDMADVLAYLRKEFQKKQ
jgi:mono/diheme cytochrome c family protein